MVGACGAFVGSSEFYKTCRKGNRVLVVQRCHNSYGRFLSMSEFGQKRRRGFISVPEGSKGKGVRRFEELLRVAVSSPSVSGVKYRVPEKVASYSYVDEGRNGTFVEVLKKPLPCMEGSREVRGMIGGKILHARGQLMQKSVHILKGDDLSLNESTSGAGKDFSLKAMHDALLDMKLMWISC